MHHLMAIAVGAAVVTAPAAQVAQNPRDLLTAAAFQAPSKDRALVLVGQAITASDRILAAHPGDHEALLERGVAIGYRGKLTHSRADVMASLDIFKRVVEQNPRDPDAQIVIASWHLGAVDQLGSFIAGTALGAKAQTGEAALAKAVALGGDRALYPGLASMMQIRRDHGDVSQARRWAEAAAVGETPTQLDSIMKRAAIALLPALRQNDGKAAAQLARKLLPFGKLGD